MTAEEYTVTLRVTVPPGEIPGLKESIALALERFGEVEVISIAPVRPQRTEQLQFELG